MYMQHIYIHKQSSYLNVCIYVCRYLHLSHSLALSLSLSLPISVCMFTVTHIHDYPCQDDMTLKGVALRDGVDFVSYAFSVVIKTTTVGQHQQYLVTNIHMCRQINNTNSEVLVGVRQWL